MFSDSKTAKAWAREKNKKTKKYKWVVKKGQHGGYAVFKIGKGEDAKKYSLSYE